MPDKVVWGLEDIIVLAADAKRQIKAALEWAEKDMVSLPLAIRLGNLANLIGTIHAKAKDARQGEYEQ